MNIQCPICGHYQRQKTVISTLLIFDNYVNLSDAIFNIFIQGLETIMSSRDLYERESPKPFSKCWGEVFKLIFRMWSGKDVDVRVIRW